MNAKKWLLLIESLIATICFPGIFLYCHNVDVSGFKEIFPAISRYCVIAILVGVCLYIIFRNIAKSFLGCEIMMLFLMNFNTIHTFFAHISPFASKKVFVVFFGALLLLILWLIKKKGTWSAEVVTFIGILFSGLILLNVFTATPAIISRISKSEVERTESSLAKQVFTNEEKPNVYYMVFDEYAGFENIKRYYGYDNEPFYNALVEQEVNVSLESYNREGICTYAILPNLLNLDYVASEDMDEIDCWQLTEDPALYQLFHNNGYQINMINHLWTLNTTGCNVLNENVEAQTLSDYLEADGILSEIDEWKNRMHVRLYGTESTQYNVVLKDTLNLMENSVDYVDENVPTFTMVYMCCPHALFVLDEEGNFTDEDVYNDFQDATPYVNQLKYTNLCIEQTILNIKKKDPNALIIIQSDHGGRYPHQMAEEYGVPYDATTETIYMQNILNCVYYRDEKIDIEGLSGINTLRYALNYVLGTEFEMLDEPEGYIAWTGTTE